VNLKDDAHTPDDFLLQALETAQPYQIETLVYLAEKEDAPIADSVTEGVFLWLKQSSWLQHYRQAHGLSGDWPDTNKFKCNPNQELYSFPAGN
jgi:hypothetical protein